MQTGSLWTNLKSTVWLQMLLIAGAIALAYGHTLSVPFYLDDTTSITSNPGIYQQNLTLLWASHGRRIGTYFTFFLNFSFNQLDVAGYHAVNIAIHLSASLAALMLARALLARVRPEVSGQNGGLQSWLPLLVALLFALHPLQTQAVTYIAQRAAELVALFYLFTLYAYCQARTTGNPASRLAWMLATIVSGGLAFGAKENAATLPFALLLLEWLFISRNAGERVRAALVTLGALVVLWIGAGMMLGFDSVSLASLQALTAETSAISRADYFATQVKVLWHYIGLFFWPTGLHLEYDTPLTNGMLAEGAMLALAGHTLLIGLAVGMRKRAPLATFGVLFYYLAHGVESSIIPISDLVFEHRTYLPNFGISLAVASVGLEFADKRKAGVPAVMASLAVLVALTALTWQRNALWGNAEAFYKDNLSLAPNAYRVKGTLSSIYVTEQRYAEALTLLQQTEEGAPAEMRQNFLTNKILALAGVGKLESALQLADDVLQNNTVSALLLRSKIYNVRAFIYAAKKNLPKVEENLVEAIGVDPSNTNSMKNLAGLYAATGRLEQAEGLCQGILSLEPHNEDAKSLMQSIRRAQGR